MMNKIILSYFILISTIVLGQSDTLNQTDEDGLKQGYWIFYGKDKPEKGYPLDGIIEEGNYLNNRKNGKWIKYHKDGVTPRLIGHYSNGRPSGSYKKIGSSGYLLETGEFERGKQLGTHIVYDECGKVQRYSFYNEEGKKHGLIRYYFPSCNCPDTSYKILEATIMYENGVAIDTMFRYYPSGCLKTRIIFSEDGQKKSQENFEDTCVVDTCYTRIKNSTGKRGPSLPKDENIFDPNGRNKVYNKANDIWMEGTFKSGKLWDGKLYKYDSQGWLIRIEVWKNGKYKPNSSENTDFSPCDKKLTNQNDELIWNGTCKNGKPWNGKKYIYDEDGILLKIEIWKNGKYYADGQL